MRPQICCNAGNCILDEPLSGYPGGRTGTHYLFLPNGYVILQLINPIRIPGGMTERRRKPPETSFTGYVQKVSLEFGVAASSRFLRMTNSSIVSGKTRRLWRKNTKLISTLIRTTQRALLSYLFWHRSWGHKGSDYILQSLWI